MSSYDLGRTPNRQETGSLFKWFIWIVAVVFLFSCIGGLASLAFGWISLPGKVLNPDAALARWQYFYDTVQAEKGLDANIKQTVKSLDDFNARNPNPSTWNFAQQDEYNRLVTVRDGYISGYNSNAQAYNAKMRDITRNFARPPDLQTCIPDWGTQDCGYGG